MSEKNRTKDSKKWLVSRMKTSGSKRRYVGSFDYSDSRNSRRKQDIEELPTRESMSKNFQFYNGKINTDLLKRFLRTKVGENWDDVYSEVIERIPSRLQGFKYCIYWYVADKVEIKEGTIWNLRDNHFIDLDTSDHYSFKMNYRYMEFYVDPKTNKLVRIGDFRSRKATRDLNNEELRKFREEEQRDRLKYKRSKKSSEVETLALDQLMSQRKKIEE